MQVRLLLSGKDTLLIAIPFVLVLMVTILRLDQINASPKGAATGRRLAYGADEHGEPILRDPDRRPSGTARRNGNSNGKSGIGCHRSAGDRHPERVAAGREVPRSGK